MHYAHYLIDWTYRGDRRKNISSAATATVLAQVADVDTWTVIRTVQRAPYQR